MGGNIFDKATPIKRDNVDPTLKIFKYEFSHIFHNVNIDFRLIGSAGKKDVSGDIDLALSEDLFIENGKLKLSDWDIDETKFWELYDGYRKRARTATEKNSKLRAFIKLVAEKLTFHGIPADVKNSGSGSLFCCYQQCGNQDYPGQKVQIDINIGNLEWLMFSYYSGRYEGNVKGLHRTQLIVSLFANEGMIFKHGSGVVDKETGEYVATSVSETVRLLMSLYDILFSEKTLNDYFLIQNALQKYLDVSRLHSVYDTYLKILDSTRADIPDDLQTYWKKNKERLNLSGQFLPENSKLYE